MLNTIINLVLSGKTVVLNGGLTSTIMDELLNTLNSRGYSLQEIEHLIERIH